MKFYFIYSAGGGAGDWNGVKRVWNTSMPERLKAHILLKFGDIFLEHASGRNFIRPKRWTEITNLRQWLYENTADTSVLSSQRDILLDSGTAKAVNHIIHNSPFLSCPDLIDQFRRHFEDCGVFEKYADIIYASNITSAVTFDIPNPFKIRSQNGNARLNILDRESNAQLVSLVAKYANTLYSLLAQNHGNAYAEQTLFTVVNGQWTREELDIFFSALSYEPKKIAVGGMSALPQVLFSSGVKTLTQFGLSAFPRVHFLGCGGFQKTALLKANGFHSEQYSVDCSTFINRSIDGSISGAAQSGYFCYDTYDLIRISPQTKHIILARHSAAADPIYTMDEMEDILSSILLHQSGSSSLETYNARAKLIFHNADVFRHNAER